MKSSVRITLIEQAFRFAIQFATIYVAARWVSVEDWGLSALATIFVNLLVAISQLAIEPMIVRQKRIENRQLNQLWNAIFRVNTLAATALFVAAAIFPTYAASLSGAGMGMIAWSIGSVSRSLLVRWQRFGRLLRLGVASSTVNFVVTSILAISGFGAWSLVMGQSSAILAYSIMALRRSYWTPSVLLKLKLDINTEFIGQSSQTLLYSFSARNFDSIVLLVWAGLNELGTYDRLYALPLAATQAVGLIVNRVYLRRLSVAFHALPHESDFLEQFAKYQHGLALISLLIHLPFLLAPGLVLSLLYGTGLDQFGIELMLIGFASYAQTLTATTGTLYIASNRLADQIRLMRMTTALYLTLFIICGITQASVTKMAIALLLASIGALAISKSRLKQDFSIHGAALLPKFENGFSFAILLLVASSVTLHATHLADFRVEAFLATSALITTAWALLSRRIKLN